MCPYVKLNKVKKKGASQTTQPPKEFFASILIHTCNTDVKSISVILAGGNVGLRSVIVITDVRGKVLIEFVPQVHTELVILFVLTVQGSAVERRVLEGEDPAAEEVRDELMIDRTVKHEGVRVNNVVG